MGDLGLTGFSSDDTQTYLPCGVWDWTKDQTCVPCIGRQILNHSTTREVWAEGLTLKKKKAASPKLCSQSIAGRGKKKWKQMMSEWMLSFLFLLFLRFLFLSLFYLHNKKSIYNEKWKQGENMKPWGVLWLCLETTSSSWPSKAIWMAAHLKKLVSSGQRRKGEKCTARPKPGGLRSSLSCFICWCHGCIGEPLTWTEEASL